jgi:hypothetical protein
VNKTATRLLARYQRILSTVGVERSPMREEINQHPFEMLSPPSKQTEQLRITVSCRFSFLRSYSQPSTSTAKLTSNSRSCCMPGIVHYTYNGVALSSYFDSCKPLRILRSTDISSMNNFVWFGSRVAGQSRTHLLRSSRQLLRRLTSFSWLISFRYTNLCIGERRHYGVSTR